MAVTIPTDPFSLLVLAVTAVCVVGAFLFLSQRSEHRVSKAKSLVDMSSSLRKEESASSVDKVDDRVLHPLQFKPFKVLKISRLSPNTKLIRFEIPHGRTLGLSIGKHVSIQAHVDGNRVIRAYTPSSPIDQAGCFDLVVKSYEFGKLSPFLHSLKVGQEVEVRGPVGRFKYAKNAHKRIGLIAGGTGLTPCLQVIRTILECPEYKDDTTHFVLFFQNRTEDDILLQDDLTALAHKHAHRLQVLFFLSNPSSEHYGRHQHERRGYICGEMMAKHLAVQHCPLVGLCGPSGFNDFAKGKLKEVGHDDSTIFVW